MKRFFASLVLIVSLWTSPAIAEGPVLVELFSSQNCRSCPKAHRTLKAVSAEREDLLVLTWSVDYWDYLGDKDPMAMKESKDRQRGYTDRFGLRGPYTPQTVYNGLEQCAGSKRHNVDRALERLEAREALSVDLVRKGNKLRLSGRVPDLADIWLVDYLSGDANTTDMVNPVTRVTALGPWLGNSVELDIPVCDSGCAVIVQESGFGPVLATMVIAP
ncbi:MULTISPECIES: DUF1223 domain-containing protein [Hyphomonas]|jgi:hypothetical protein|uniref:DUF1223 domain-containing protein n=1 Tax=Hyphomonas atlantica TaxID=1280948 RepID=A0A353YRK8_9PROT|nr:MULTISPECIES: DUF1223 domain-containing protein [Hyphomonas]OUX85168.1 MAG: hypothetical protein CBB91_09475 [Hyphomonas sp. TMED31]MAH93430.1 hypothetical protein [Hyphomonas sp.]HAE95318.1 hypothetical protein [Hyphomonas atlantica]HBH45645.1 hypothetical protein [Hyphomonas atlantica]HBQ49711.1 hypothetical protein [Hyphomonas atlantica]|tara:strand:- start:883 stop:1533 length:651 start_codon:yes stop_codon:yes gene_type:complete